MRVLYYDEKFPSELYDKETKGVAYISKKAWQSYVDREEIDYRIAGQTKLKAVKDSEDSVLEVETESGRGRYVVKKYPLSNIKGYIPVGNNKFLIVAGSLPCIFILIGIFLILCGVLGLFLFRTPQAPVINRYIEDSPMTEVNADSTATRYRFNTSMTVIQNTIQNLKFENINEKKQLRIKIKLHPEDKDYVYDSGMVPSGKIVTSDVLLYSVEPGEYPTIAECYSYNEAGEQQSQTNFEVKLLVQ